MDIAFCEERFLVKTLADPGELDAALRLRHRVFREELKWVPTSPDGLDLDEFDAYSHGIGVFDDQRGLIGHVRLIKAPDPFMAEKDFSSLLTEGHTFVKAPDMAESTRICVDKDYRRVKVGGLPMAHLLYKAIYHWCLGEGVRHLETIIEKRYYVYLKRYFPFVPVAEFGLMGEGVETGIVMLDWREFEQRAREKRPEFFNWITTATAPVPGLSPQHGPCSPHRVSSRYSERETLPSVR